MSVKPESMMADGFFMSFMYLYHILFTEFHMFKPHSSSPGSGEFYAVARGFHSITTEQRKLLLDYLGNFSMNKPMFAKSDIPKFFSDKVCKFINDLQLVNIQNMVAAGKITTCFTSDKGNHKNAGLDCSYLIDKTKFIAEKNENMN